jgi:hypothetical protein
MGYCFANTVQGECALPHGTQADKVSQKDCCCVQGGGNWGTDCKRCPALGSDEYNALCTDYKTSAEKNECKFIAGVCKHGKCMDTEDGFRCMCNSGFKLAMSGKKCEDIDECMSPKLNKCGPNGACRNTVGGYECVCESGYLPSVDKTTCEDENECQTGRHNCEMECFNTVGSFKCMCPVGFKAVGNGCKDVDECEDADICGVGTCNNVDGSYECVCSRGLRFDKDKKSCVYVDDGKGDTGDTGVDGTGSGCKLQTGCACPKGYHPYSFFFGQIQCVDVNECQQNMCGQSSCSNEIGSYRCGCPNGFQYQGGSCKDVNECRQGPCSYQCENYQGGYACRCPTGYYAQQGGICVATYGAMCYDCDTSDIPEEVPLDGSEDVAVSRGGENIIARHPAAQYHSNNYGIQNYGGLYSNYGSYYEQPQMNYHSYWRAARSANRKIPKKKYITINYKDLKPSVSLVKLAPLMKKARPHMMYHLLGSNNFELRHLSDRGASVHATGELKANQTYFLTITTRMIINEDEVKETNNKIDKEKKDAEEKARRELKEISRENKKFNLKIVVSIVDSTKKTGAV